MDSGLGNHEVHRYVVRLRIDRRQTRYFKGDADGERCRRYGCQCAIEIAAAIAESIALRVETVHGYDRSIRHHGRRAVREWNVIDTRFERRAWPPGAKLKRQCLPDYHWKCGRCIAFAETPDGKTRIELTFEWPAKGDRHTGKERKAGFNMCGDCIFQFAPALERNRITQGNQLRALLLAPLFDFRPTLVHIDLLNRAGTLILLLCALPSPVLNVPSLSFSQGY